MAPKDHKSNEFQDWLRDNNTVNKETDEWLVIENIKYHREEKPWYTAFLKEDRVGLDVVLTSLMLEYPGYSIILHHPAHQTIRMFHVHLIKGDRPYTVHQYAQ